MIQFIIDELSQCLKDATTGDIVETECVRIKRRTFLSKFNEKTGWYVDWSGFPRDVEIYALVIKGTMDIQGLIALKPELSVDTVHIYWACVSPENNVWEYGKKRYSGVGGHLFAIACNKSIEYGFGGYVYAEAMDQDILDHYIDVFHAEKFPFGYPKHPYRFIINENSAREITEVYTYASTDEEI